MYEVVMAVDESEERALQLAEAVADLPGAGDLVHVTILHDFTNNPSGASVGQVASVRRASEYLEDHDVNVSLEESSGDPAQAIIAEADDRDADLICLAARKRSPTGKALFGSVSQEVMLNTDRPVLVVGRRSR